MFLADGRAIDLDKLRVRSPVMEVRQYGLGVGRPTIGSSLEVSHGGLIQLADESPGIARGALSQVPSDNEFCGSLDGDKAVGIPSLRVAAGVVLFLAAAIAPNFVALDIAHPQAAKCTLKQPFAMLANQDKHVQDCVAVNSQDSLDAAHAYAFDEQADNLSDLFR